MRTRRTADDFRRDMEAKLHTTPGDIEREQRIDANAREALRRPQERARPTKIGAQSVSR
jgi:hypothetical protein